jgi:hypothetical protein
MQPVVGDGKRRLYRTSGLPRIAKAATATTTTTVVLVQVLQNPAANQL